MERCDQGIVHKSEHQEAVQIDKTRSVSEDIYNKVKEVLLRDPRGFPILVFSTIYRNIHGVSLNVRELGFNKLDAFLQHLVRAGMIKLKYEANILVMIPAPALITGDLTMGHWMGYNAFKAPELKRRNDVMRLGDKITLQPLPPDVREGNFLEVIVAEVFDPYKFCIQLKGETTSAALETLYDEMEILYDGPDSEQYKIPDKFLDVGLVCASLYGDGYWHRAYIKAFVDLYTVEVFYIDYCTSAKVKKNSLRYLSKKFGDLPGQGIEARLAGIKPEGGLRKFTKETSCRFLELVRMPPDVVGLVAVVKGLVPKLTLWLVDTSTNDLPEGVAINQVLVDEGLAEPDDSVDDDPSGKWRRPVVKHLDPLRRPMINCKSNENEMATMETTTRYMSTELVSSWGSVKKAEIRELQDKPDMLAATVQAKNHPDVVNQFMKLQLVQQDQVKLQGRDYTEDEEISHPDSGYFSSPSRKSKKIIRPMNLPGHNVDSVFLEETKWMTSCQISQLIPNWKGRDILYRMLKLKRMSVENLVATSQSHPEVFLALMEGGLISSETKEVRLFPIKSVPHILNILLPAPATELKKALQNQIESN